MVLTKTSWSMYGQLWVLSFMQLVPKFKSSFYTRFLLLLMSMAVGLGWYQSSWVIQKPRFWEVLLCAALLDHVQLLTSTALHCGKAMGPPCHLQVSAEAPSPLILARCVVGITGLSNTERFGCSLHSVEAGWPLLATCIQIKHLGLCKRNPGR